MADRSLPAFEERAHPPGADPDWEESWYFDFVAGDGALAGFSRIGLRPDDGCAWWWAGVVGTDMPYVLVRDHEVDLPRRGTLEIRAPGLWAEPVCETPFDHWSLGLEALAVALDDPAEAYGSERGEPTPLGFDLEWEMESAPAGLADGTGYRQAATVHGDVLIASQRLSVEASGQREHRWGPENWAQPTGDDLPLDERGLLADGVLHGPVQVPGVCRIARAVLAGGRWAERRYRYPASSTAF